MSKILFEKTDRIGRITLNRPEVLNAIDDEVPALLSEAVDGRDRGVYDWTDDRPINTPK